MLLLHTEQVIVIKILSQYKALSDGKIAHCEVYECSGWWWEGDGTPGFFVIRIIAPHPVSCVCSVWNMSILD